jgi:hypothetical protein
LFSFRLLFDLRVNGDDTDDDDEDDNDDDINSVGGIDFFVGSIGMGPVFLSFSENV